LCALSTSLVAEVLAVTEIKLPLVELVAAVEPEVVAPELPAVAGTAGVTGDPTFDTTMGVTPLAALTAEESLGLEPPHAASMQNNAPKALPRANIFIVESL
jgi:hypothetical protein